MTVGRSLFFKKTVSGLFAFGQWRRSLRHVGCRFLEPLRPLCSSCGEAAGAFESTRGCRRGALRVPTGTPVEDKHMRKWGHQTSTKPKNFFEVFVAGGRTPLRQNFKLRAIEHWAPLVLQYSGPVLWPVGMVFRPPSGMQQATTHNGRHFGVIPLACVVCHSGWYRVFRPRHFVRTRFEHALKVQRTYVSTVQLRP